MKRVFCLLLVMLLHSPAGLAALAFPDGSWNGKPWEHEKLEAGVKRSEPQALAEWAYCSREGYLSVVYDERQIFSRAKRSAEVGNPLGMAILSRCYLIGMGTTADSKLGFEWAKKSADLGHPLGLKNLANCYYQGSHTEIDYAKGRELTEQASRQGSVIATMNLANHAYHGGFGVERDRPEGIRMMIESFEAGEPLNAARILLALVPDDPEGDTVPLELQTRVLERVYAAAECGVPDARGMIIRHLCLTGRSDEGIPMLLEACETDNIWVHEIAMDLAKGDHLSQSAGAVGHYATIFHLAREASELGADSSFVLHWTASSYLFKWGGKELEPDKAAPYALKLAARGRWSAHEWLGRIYLSKGESKLRDPRRALAHLVYSSKYDTGSLHYLAESAIIGRPEDHDNVRGYAAAVVTMEERRGIPREKAGRILKKVEKRISEEELAEAKALIKEGYPTAEKFRRDAFEILKEYGDLPEDAEFR